MSITNFSRIETLHKNNYDTWKMQMQALLIKNDYWCYANGEIKKPEDKTNQDAIKEWVKNDNKAKSDIILNISPSELKQIKNCITSNDVWIKLQDIYQSKGPARKATLLKQLTLQRMNEGEDVREHLRKFFDAVDKLGEMEVNINPDLLAIMLIYSLPASYENFRCAIESRDELPDPEVLKIKIVEESDARQNNIREPHENAMYSSNKQSRNRNIHTGNKPNVHYTPNRVNSKEPFKFQCHKCRKFGHKASECRSKEFKKNNYNNSAKRVEDVTLCAWSGSEAVNNDFYRWCIDSGATSHLSNQTKDFISLCAVKNKELKLANRNSTKVASVGTASFVARVFGDSKNITLDDTLHVPDLRTNLLSVSKMTDKGCEVLFQQNRATVFGIDGKAKLIADRVGDLYFARESGGSCSAYNSSEQISSLEVWHRRLGHLNYIDLIKSVRNGIVQGPQFRKHEDIPTCEVCCKGKMTRSSFPSSKRKSKILDIVHTDVCGPMRTESNGRSLYFITFIDDYSRWCEVRFVRSKGSIPGKVREVIALMENQRNSKVKCLQSDNGTEYINKELDNWFRKRGIARRLTVPHTPEQNGVAERKNRTLLEMARCLLIESGLPSCFWAEAVNTANYIRNRCPSRSLSGRTPYETWTGQIPKIDHLKIFGSKVLCLYNSPGRGKLQPRSRAGIFLGYSEQSKGYRVWLNEEKKVEISRDIKFLEEVKKYDLKLKAENNQQIEDIEGITVIMSPKEDKQVAVEDKQEQEIVGDNPKEKDHQSNLEEPTDKNDVGNEEVLHKRGPGRPKYTRTGKVGRPRKIYNDKQKINNDEIVQTCEVPLNSALSGPDSTKWLEAMKEELRCIVKNDTWTLVDRPLNDDVIGSRMVLRNKFKPDGSFDKMKARLVAQGFSQKPGIHFNETFAPVARLSTIRLAIAIAARHNMFLEQLDVTAAFLQGNLNETIFMEPPKKLDMMLDMLSEDQEESIRMKSMNMLKDLKDGNKVCLLKKSLYGLKQAGRAWHEKLNGVLTSMEAVPSKSDPCLYYISNSNSKCPTLIIVYVDDILIASQDSTTIQLIKEKLAEAFDVKELGKVKHCLGIEFQRSNNKITLLQRGYISEILKRFEMSECKPVSTPINSQTKLTKPTTPYNPEEFENLPYRELVGALTYLSVCTRPDISFAASYLGQFNNCFDRTHWTAAKRVLRYLKGTIEYGIVYDKCQDPLKGYVDSDWGNCGLDRRSFTGYVFLIGGSPITWDARKQKTVALSSTEAEYMGMSEAIKEAIYLRSFLLELSQQEAANLILHTDSASALKLAQNATFHNRTKHIDIRHHFVREALKNTPLKLEHVGTEEMWADLMTKGLPRPKHLICIQGLRMSSASSA